MELRKVVIRFLDGTVKPGYAPLFDEGLDTVYASDPSGFPITVHVKELKAVFFVRTFSGNPAYDPASSPSPEPTSPDLVRLRFSDGESMLGEVGPGTDSSKAFYITVLDPNDNNVMIYINPGALESPPARAASPESPQAPQGTPAP